MAGTPSPGTLTQVVGPTGATLPLVILATPTVDLYTTLETLLSTDQEPVSPHPTLFFFILYNKHPQSLFTDKGGNGGTSISGDAYGGHAKRSSSYPYPYPYFPSYSQGGNAQTGSSGNANGGDVVNYGGYIWNGWGASKCSVCLSSTYDFDETDNSFAIFCPY